MRAATDNTDQTTLHRPTVSVIIPVFNRRERIAGAIHSALAQDLLDMELLVGDDGSTDDTAEMVAALAAREERIRLFSWPVNAGVATARNRLIRAARGRYLALLDSDDRWQKDKLRLQLEVMDREGGIGVCHTLERWFRGEQEVKVPKGLLRIEEDPYLANLTTCTISPSSSLIPRELLEDHGLFDPGLAACEDQDLWLRLAARGVPFYCLAEPLVMRHGGRADQLSRRIPALDRFRIICLLKQLLDPALPERYRIPTKKMVAKKAAILASGSRKRGKALQEERYLALQEWAGAGGTTPLSIPE